MADLSGFDANDHEPTGDFEPIPKGEYLAQAIGSEWKDTKNGKGAYLQFAFEILEGEHKGRKLWDRLNLQNQNETAVRIANGSLSAICRAIGVMRPKDSNELHNKPLIAKVVVEERSDKPGVFKNEIKGYESTSAAATKPSNSESKGNGKSSKPPWQK